MSTINHVSATKLYSRCYDNTEYCLAHDRAMSEHNLPPAVASHLAVMAQDTLLNWVCDYLEDNTQTELYSRDAEVLLPAWLDWVNTMRQRIVNVSRETKGG